MNRNELHLALRTIPFLNSLADNENGTLRLREDRWLVWRPDLIGWIFRADRSLTHPASRTLSPLLGTRSLLWMDGPEHAAYRRLIGPALRGKQLASYRVVIADVVRTAIDDLPPGIGLAQWTRKLTLRVIMRIVLGAEDPLLLARFTGWLDRELGCRVRTLAHRYLGRGLPRFDDEVDRMLLRRARNARPPALAALLPATDDRELRDQLVSLLFAGHETTASATAWTVYWLDRHPAVRAQVLDQLGDEDAPLLRAVIQEALRLCPPATLAGNRVTAEGVVLTPSIYLAHRRRERFPEPETFDPGRFLGERVSGQHFFPFGGGVRHCLGNELALLEIRMIVTALLRRREWRCVPPRTCTPQLRGAAMAPPAGLRMVTTCRR
jgi:cytochrome P450